jgi:hypothetical protein
MARFTLSRRWIYTLDALVLLATAGIVAVALTANGERYDAACSKTGDQFAVTVADDQFSKTQVAMQRCDTLRVTNNGSEDLHLALGLHEQHIVYPGYAETTIAPGESLTFVARKPGRYQMHDHLRDVAKTTLLIRERD